MIYEAHIGIGIYGHEGLQAVQASDYAIGEFRCLWRLILVHGRWSYIRITEMILYFFYKNMIFTMPQFFFAFASGFGGTSLFDTFYVQCYNMVFTSLPLVAKAICEQDVNYLKIRKDQKSTYEVKNLKDNYPYLYYVGQENTLFGHLKFIKWFLGGAFQSLIIWFICMWVFPNGIMSSDGYSSDLWTFSITYYTCILIVISQNSIFNFVIGRWF